ncbi:hypothetical protein [Chondromyces crocatus]|uniref:Protein kinase domain-containing protein n=1 Tax=Chondromyces crocatus TaxID=52 RepID=A0A0K1EKJ1_CHOCO|nr:hypothetical protein [Chondromyces crocatus]AKT41187.1 uncharacterized protein CMC5_053480 [Chondromyces crocatus]
MRLIRLIHAGTHFDVHEVEVGGRKLALKVPSDRAMPSGPGHENLFLASRVLGGATTDWDVRCHGGSLTRLMADNEVADVEDAEGVGELLLRDEIRRLHAAAASWNHAALGLIRCEVGGRRGLPGLLMPLLEGAPLGSLPLPAQRRLLPRMIPALWDAIATVLHGDVEASNLLVAPVEDRFALIDPGALVLRHLPERGASRGSDVLTFITNVDTYPVLPPYAITPPLGEGATLRDHWHSFRESMTRSDFAPPFKVGTTDAGRWTSTRAGRFLVDVAVERGEPHPADLLAVGVMYYRALTGVHPLYEDELSRPGWLNLVSVDDALSGGEAMTARLDRGLRPPSSIDASVTPAEEALALALLDLQVPSQGHLRALCEGATAGAEVSI